MSLPPHVPLYASVHPFRVECPVCTTLILVTGYRATDAAAFDPVASVLKCPKCSRAYYVGIMLWDAPGGRANVEGREVPPGVRPNRRQLAQLRLKVGKGFWSTVPHTKGEEIHHYEAEGCTCETVPERCPVHTRRGANDV